MPAFLPILGVNPTRLILGSMPSNKSLEARQYYAHPRNAFWPIMARLYRFASDESYEKRVNYLKEHKVSVWDVLHDCERQGSLDSRIVRNSETPNDFSAFLRRQTDIQLVAFNGQAARKIFSRHCKALYDEFSQIVWVDLPSSSPAHASMTHDEKAEVWRERLAFE